MPAHAARSVRRVPSALMFPNTCRCAIRSGTRPVRLVLGFGEQPLAEEPEVEPSSWPIGCRAPGLASRATGR